MSLPFYECPVCRKRLVDCDGRCSPAYEVTCARCGKQGLSSEFFVEEGDEWECPDCWHVCEAKERADKATGDK